MITITVASSDESVSNDLACVASVSVQDHILVVLKLGREQRISDGGMVFLPLPSDFFALVLIFTRPECDPTSTDHILADRPANLNMFFLN